MGDLLEVLFAIDKTKGVERFMKIILNRPQDGGPTEVLKKLLGNDGVTENEVSIQICTGMLNNQHTKPYQYPLRANWVNRLVQ